MKRMKTFEAYTPEEDSHIQDLKDLASGIAKEVEDFLQGWEKNPLNKSMYPITSMREAWANFVEKSRGGWEERLKPLLKTAIYWEEIKGGNNPFKVVGEVTHTMDLLGKSYLDVRGRQSYEGAINALLDQKPAMAADVYVPAFFSPETKRNIESISIVTNMGLL